MATRSGGAEKEDTMMKILSKRVPRYHADVQMDRSLSVLPPTQGLRDERGGKDITRLKEIA
jgi:hypothetical protein